MVDKPRNLARHDIFHVHQVQQHSLDHDLLRLRVIQRIRGRKREVDICRIKGMVSDCGPMRDVSQVALVNRCAMNANRPQRDRNLGASGCQLPSVSVGDAAEQQIMAEEVQIRTRRSRCEWQRRGTGCRAISIGRTGRKNNVVAVVRDVIQAHSFDVESFPEIALGARQSHAPQIHQPVSRLPSIEFLCRGNIPDDDGAIFTPRGQDHAPRL